MSRIKTKFGLLKTEGRAALISYIMGYDPDKEISQKIMDSLPKAGVDIIELGMPFSDPAAEGPIIQAAAKRALKAGGSVKNILDMVQNFRSGNDDTPIVLMGYFNPIHHYGIEQFVSDAKTAGVDGLIIVDLPPEEEGEFTQFAYPAGIDLIKLSAPTTDEARAKVVFDDARGFAYYVSITGITGTKTADFAVVKERLKVIRTGTDLPIAVGFGIKTPEHAAEVAEFADAVVVGSAIVELAKDGKTDNILEFVESLSVAIKNTTSKAA
jgi:tryptophan synthase alpha chain